MPLLLLKQHSGCGLRVHTCTQSTHSQALPILHLLWSSRKWILNLSTWPSGLSAHHGFLYYYMKEWQSSQSQNKTNMHLNGKSSSFGWKGNTWVTRDKPASFVSIPESMAGGRVWYELRGVVMSNAALQVTGWVPGCWDAEMPLPARAETDQPAATSLLPTFRCYLHRHRSLCRWLISSCSNLLTILVT